MAWADIFVYHCDDLGLDRDEHRLAGHRNRGVSHHEHLLRDEGVVIQPVVEVTAKRDRRRELLIAAISEDPPVGLETERRTQDRKIDVLIRVECDLHVTNVVVADTQDPRPVYDVSRGYQVPIPDVKARAGMVTSLGVADGNLQDTWPIRDEHIAEFGHDGNDRACLRPMG